MTWIDLSSTAMEWANATARPGEALPDVLRRNLEQIAAQWKRDNFVPRYTPSWRRTVLRRADSKCNDCREEFPIGASVVEMQFECAPGQSVTHYFHRRCSPETDELPR